MNNLQRFVVLTNGIVIGTDSGQAFTERAAKQKCELLNRARPKQDFKVVELTPLLIALS